MSTFKKASARFEQKERAGSYTSVKARASSRGLEGAPQTKDLEETLFTPLEQKYQSGRVAPRHHTERKQLSEHIEVENSSPLSSTRA